MLVCLGVAMTALESLDGPQLQVAASLADHGYGPTFDSMEVVGTEIVDQDRLTSCTPFDVGAGLVQGGVVAVVHAPA